MFFLMLSYDISTTLLQILFSLRFPNHPFKGIYCILSSETLMVEFFLSTLVGLPGIAPKSSLEQLFCRQGFFRTI